MSTPSVFEMIKWQRVAILLARKFGKGFPPDSVKRESVFISTWEIYLFPFISISHSFISPGKERVSLKQSTRYVGGSRFTTDLYRGFHCEICMFRCGQSWEFFEFLLPSIWVAMLCSLIDQHDSVLFVFCLFLFVSSTSSVVLSSSSLKVPLNEPADVSHVTVSGIFTELKGDGF